MRYASWTQRSRRLFSCVAGLLAVSAISAMPLAAKADEAVVSFDSGSGTIQPAGVFTDTIGWAFTPTQTIAVTGFGWWDNNHDGLNDMHQIAIWDNGSMTMMGSDILASGVGGTLVGDFRYYSTPAFLLQGGQTYVIGGMNNQEDYTYGVTNLTMGSDVTYLQNRYDGFLSGSLTFPAATFGPSEPGYFGPSFQYTAVPEPGTYAMGAGMALSALLSLRRRRARK